jgi:TonB-linked SusC/RagA family outer membrane protein
MKNKKRLFLIPLLFLTVFGISAQQKIINGTVLGDNLPLPGVSISIKNKKLGTLTNMDGKYEIVALPGTILVFNYIGFKSQEVTVKDKNVIDIILVSIESILDEVVVIGYGTVKRKDLTGAVSTVTAADIEKVKSVSFEAALANKVSGVQVVSSEGGPGSALKIKIRGGTSINASNDPLYVIDGFPISGGGVSTDFGNSTTSPLASLDPSNIESIDILKDASATAIYGSRGANGVVIITTKQGKKGIDNLTFETYSNVSNLSNRLDVLTPQEFINYQNSFQPWSETLEGQKKYLAESYRIDDGTGNYIPVTLDYKYPAGTGSGLDGRGLIIDDWQDKITRTAFTKYYSLAANGGSDKTKYSASISYLNTEGIIKTSGLERYSLNMNVNQKLSDRIKAGFKINSGYTLRRGVVTSSTNNSQGRAGVVTSATLFSPVQPVRNSSNNETEATLGIFYDANGRMISNQNGDISNPTIILEENKSNGMTFEGRFNTFFEFKIIEGLFFKTSIRGFASYTKNKAYFSENIGWSRNVGGSATTNFLNSNSVNTEQNLSYNKKFGNHSIGAVLVAETQQNKYESLITISQGFGLPGVNVDNLQSALTTFPTRSDAVSSTLQSYLARVQYDGYGKYLLTVSARYDGSSKFALNNKWGFFPSVGIAWKISEEGFIKNSSFISNAKIRASFGETGNQEIGTFQSLARAGLASYVFDGSALATGAAISRLANPNLTWETTTQKDIGLSLGLFDNRINIEADYYDKVTSDLLLEVPIPASSGFTTAFKNLGSVSNKGFEFALDASLIEKGNFKWKANFNISFNKNKVLNLGGANEFFVTAIGDNAIQGDYVVRVGESLGSIYGLQDDGVYNFKDFKEFEGMSDAEAALKLYSDTAVNENWYATNIYNLKDGVVKNSLVANGTYRPGMTKFEDTNKDGIINDQDRKIIGNTQPLHFGGFTNDFSYKQFDLSVQTGWSYGNDIYNKNIKKGINTANPWGNKLAIVNNRWDPEHPENTLTSFNSGASGNFNSAAYSSYIEDGSYLRLRNITLGYKLSKKVTKTMGVQSFRFYAAVDNVFVWTKYSGWDPDVSVGNNQLTPGLDSDSYPRDRTFRIGLSTKF